MNFNIFAPSLSFPICFWLIYLCDSHPLPCHHALILLFYAHLPDSFIQPPFFLTVILSSRPSSFYSCCQISLSTPGKLHFSDYTPIKGPVGTLFACCSSSLETGKWIVSLHVCLCVCACMCVCRVLKKEPFKILAAEKKHMYVFVNV